MKKLVVIGILLLSFARMESVRAAEKKAIIQDENPNNELFGNWDDSDKVVELPDGTYLKGEAEVISSTTNFSRNVSDSTQSYNSESDPNALTVEEAKEQAKNINSNKAKFSTRGVDPSFNTAILRNKAEVKVFFRMTRGWHSLNTVYQSLTGTGPYLLYSMYNDSALVGSAQQATNSMLGLGVYGNISGRDSSQYFTGANTLK